jgi:multisubunit Na+/H+ antiporter MnhB subunit
MLLIISLQAINILSAFGIIKYFFFYDMEFSKRATTIEALSLYIILLVPNYYFLYRKRDEILKRYENETKEDKTWGIINVILYIVITITVFFVLGETIVKKHY